jgi:hypothetical protein
MRPRAHESPTRRYVVPRRTAPLPAQRRLRTEIDAYDIAPGVHEGCAALFFAALQECGLCHVHALEVPRDRVELDDPASLGRVQLAWRTPARHDVLLTLADGGVALIGSGHGRCDVVVAIHSDEKAAGAARKLAGAVRREPPADERVRVRFWSSGSHGPTSAQRTIEAPTWEEVARNYPAGVRDQLDGLAAARAPGAGALLVWHGPPGCGKTHALRALLRGWRDWAQAHYVTDPERLLAGTDYLMEVATHHDEEDKRWRLLVLEDAGELLADSARAETGQGLSRMLNLTDGLLGQGVRCALLVTTNEPLGRLHPAVRRPGRCWAEVGFTPFAAAEAAAWLALHGHEEASGSPATLAELYARLDGRAAGDESPARSFGFSRALDRA